MSDTSRNLIGAEEIAALPEIEGHHRLNPESEFYFRSLSALAGLQRIAVHLYRLPPGREPAEYHSHRYEEEFFYILSGRGRAIIDGKEHEVGAGDFIAFPTPSVAHTFRNDSDGDLLYLAGGERREFEIGEFPRRGKLVIRDRGRAYIVSRDNFEDFTPAAARHGGS